MKIITDNAVYIQKVDLEFFKYELRSLPKFISLKIFENKEIDMDDYEKYDFLKFEDEEIIEFLKKIDWIIDYDLVKNLTDDEIREIGRTYAEKFESVNKKIYTTSPNKKDYKDLLQQSKLLFYQLRSIEDLLDFKGGRLKITLPKDENKFLKLVRKLTSKKNN